MKKTDNRKSTTDAEFKEIPVINKKAHLYSSNLNNVIKNLTNPRFLGSMHMRKETSSNMNSSIENLIEDELKLKITKSLKNTLFNPFTKTLILIAIVFNLIWFLLITIF